MIQKIDLNTAPSMMEQTAASWAGQAPASRAPKSTPRRVTAQRFAKKPIPPTSYPVEKAAQTKKRTAGPEYASAADNKDAQVKAEDLIAYKAYLRSFIADLPDAAVLVISLGEEEREGLRTAFWTHAGWAARPEFVQALRQVGLCCVGTEPGGQLTTENRLGPYGEECRRALLKMERDD